MDRFTAKNKDRAVLAKGKSDTTVPPIMGTFEDAVRAMLKTPPAPKNLGRPKAKAATRKKKRSQKL